MKPHTTIEDVIEVLDSIIEESQAEESSMGYFAILYHKVTIKVKEGIENDYFEDGKRMEHLDIVFAQRYIDAYYSRKNNIPVIES